MGYPVFAFLFILDILIQKYRLRWIYFNFVLKCKLFLGKSRQSSLDGGRADEVARVPSNPEAGDPEEEAEWAAGCRYDGRGVHQSARNRQQLISPTSLTNQLHFHTQSCGTIKAKLIRKYMCSYVGLLGRPCTLPPQWFHSCRSTTRWKFCSSRSTRFSPACPKLCQVDELILWGNIYFGNCCSVFVFWSLKVDLWTDSFLDTLVV